MRKTNNNPIGIFDSGIGGLTVVKEIVKALPNESIIYLGDTARVPYGPRSKEVILQFSKELVNFLLKRKVKFLVVACNTISATVLDEIRKISPVPVIGVVEPTVELAVKTTKNKRLGVIGTIGTISSKAYEKMIHGIDPKIEVVERACPLFVPIAEEGLHTHQITKLIAEDYLKVLRKRKIDTLILGCTHYPILDRVISETMGKQVVLIDSAKPTAEKLKQFLTEKTLLSGNKKVTYKFYVTDAPGRAIEVASSFFGDILNRNLEQVSLSTF